MKLVKEIFRRNKLLAYLGAFFFALTALLGLYAPFNSVEILGLNSVIKPMKFAVSTGIYAWTMAYLLYYVNRQASVKWYSILAVIVMLFENSVITVQALRGKLSHFNQDSLLEGILYAFMGVMIVWLTTATLVITFRFMLQKTYAIDGIKALSIKFGFLLFVIFSYFGGYMSVVNSHNVGGEMGGDSLPLVDWSTKIGDLRVAHFFGIHALQLVPLVGFIISDKFTDLRKGKLLVWLFAIGYTAFILFAMWQAVMGRAFLQV